MEGTTVLGRAAITDRFVAALIDIMVCVAGSYPLGSVSYLVFVRLLGLPAIICIGAVAMSPLVYFTWGWAVGATPGMRAMNLQMERSGGGRPGVIRAFVRSVVVLPFVFGSGAFGLGIYAHLMGEYPSHAEPSTASWRMLGLGMIAMAYLAVVVAARWEHRGRAAHDFVSGVVVFGPARPEKPPRPITPPPKPISRWFLLALIPGLPVGTLLSVLVVILLVEGELGPALVGAVLGGAALYGCYEILRRTMTWVRGPWGMPLPRALISKPRRISRWFLVAMPPGLLLATLFAAALVSLLVEGDPGGAAVVLVPTLAILYGMWELARRTLPLPNWAGG